MQPHRPQPTAPLFSVAFRIPSKTVAAVATHLDQHVAEHLVKDVSRYAPGRERVWLEMEAPLGPAQPWRRGVSSERLWPWLTGVWQRHDPATAPDLGLAICGENGIEWHRDASFAMSPAMIVNLGRCRFEIDHDRSSPNGRPLRPVATELFGGEVLAFNCKYQHRVVEPDASRWSIVLWRLKEYPAPQDALDLFGGATADDDLDPILVP